MSPGTVDPVSTSALGGLLRAHALRLVTLLEPLGEPPPGSRRVPRPETARERELIAATAEQLDRIGSVLQGLATSGVERSVRRRGIDEEAARHELGVDGTRVTEWQGPSRIDPAHRLRARERAQGLLNRVTAAEGRDLARLSRELTASVVTLRALSAQARDDAT